MRPITFAIDRQKKHTRVPYALDGSHEITYRTTREDGYIDCRRIANCPVPDGTRCAIKKENGATSVTQNPEIYTWGQREYNPAIVGYFPLEEQTREWEGNGLPPVGLVVRYLVQDDMGGRSDAGECPYQWNKGDRLEVLAHRIAYSGNEVAVLWNIDKKMADSRVLEHRGRCLLGPLPTDEEQAIDGMASRIVDHDPDAFYDRETLASLYRAGVRFA